MMGGKGIWGGNFDDGRFGLDVLSREMTQAEQRNYTPKIHPPSRLGSRGDSKCPQLRKGFYSRLVDVRFEHAASEGEGLMGPRTPFLLPPSHTAVDVVVFEGRGYGNG